jgi:hypothetical protein
MKKKYLFYNLICIHPRHKMAGMNAIIQSETYSYIFFSCCKNTVSKFLLYNNIWESVFSPPKIKI